MTPAQSGAPELRAGASGDSQRTGARPPAIRDVIHERFSGLTKSEQGIAQLVLDRMDEVPFLNATEVAAALDLYPSSVTRFAQKLGFKGYPDLQQAVRKEMRAALAQGSANTGSSLVARHLNSEAKNFEELKKLDAVRVEQMVAQLVSAPHIWVFGPRSSLGVAELMAHFLSFLRPGVQHLSSAAGQFPEQLLDVGRDDALLMFTLQRHSALASRVAREAVARGAVLLVVSDGGPSPVNALAAHLLTVPVRAVGGFVSLTAMMSVCILFGIASAEQLGPQRLLEAEALWERFELYEGPDAR